MMAPIPASAVLLAAALWAVGASAATLVNLSATDPNRTLLSIADPALYTSVVAARGAAVANSFAVASSDLSLAEGAYEITATNPTLDFSALFTAANRFSATSGCNASGTECRQGWEHSYYVKLGNEAGVKYGYAEGLGPVPSGTAGAAYYESASIAFAHSVGSTFTFTSPGTLKLYWLDDNWSDNAGGISLHVAAVPEPQEWAMLVVGLGAIGVIFRRRRRTRQA